MGGDDERGHVRVKYHRKEVGNEIYIFDKFNPENKEKNRKNGTRELKPKNWSQNIQHLKARTRDVAKNNKKLNRLEVEL